MFYILHRYVFSLFGCVLFFNIVTVFVCQCGVMMAINIKVDVLYVLSRCAARFQLYMCIHTCKPLDEPNLIIIIIIYIYIYLHIQYIYIYISSSYVALHARNDICLMYINTSRGKSFPPGFPLSNLPI